MAAPKSSYAPSRRKSGLRYEYERSIMPEQGPNKPKKFDPEENNRNFKLKLPNGQVIRALAGASVPADGSRKLDRKKNK
jgi:hypothetical protein